MLGKTKRRVSGLLRPQKLTIVVVVTLSLALGGAASLFSLFNAVVLRTLAVEEPERLVAAFPAAGAALLGIPLPILYELHSRQLVFESTCGYSRGTVEVRIGARTARQSSEWVTGDCFPTLRIRPFLGRLIDARDSPISGDAAQVAVVSYRFWVNVLAANPHIIGSTIDVQGLSLTIVGVTPPAFVGIDVDQGADLILPLALMPRAGAGPAVALYAIGRLQRDVTIDQARRQLRSIWRGAVAADAAMTPQDATTSVLQVQSLARGLSLVREQYAKPLSVLLSLGICLVAIACVNSSALLLARAIHQDPDYSVRFALGASPFRLSGRLVAEALFLGVAIGLLAIPLASFVGSAVVSGIWTGTRPLAMPVAPDFGVMALILAAGMFAGVVTVIPIIVRLIYRARLVFREQRSSPSGASRRTFLAVQLALCTVLLFFAVLFNQHLSELRHLEPGYPTERLYWTRLELVYGSPRNIDQAAYFRPILERLVATGGVTSVALASGFPTTEVRHTTARVPFSYIDAPLGGRDRSGRVEFISPAFFATVGIPILAGREFGWTDTAVSAPVAIVNAAAASNWSSYGNVVGQALYLGNSKDPLTIVGVAGTSSPGDPRIQHLPIVYVPFLQRQQQMNSPTLLLRSSGQDLPRAALTAVIDEYGRHRIARIESIDEQMDRFLSREQVTSGVAAAFAALSVVVGGIGLYSLVAHEVVVRRREIGIRMALGATTASMLKLLVRDGAVALLIGNFVGVLGALTIGRAVSRTLLELDTSFAVPVLVTSCLVIVSGGAACLLPARDALRMQPWIATRAE